MTGQIKKFRNLRELSSIAAHEITNLANKTVSAKGVFYLALSGGNTPRTLYHLLGTTYAKAIPWKSMHIFFCDERYVPHDDKRSNYRMVKEELLDFVPIPKENVHPIPTGYSDPTEAARIYDNELREYFRTERNMSGNQPSSFDLVLLGMGREGHTASLFPGSTALDEKEVWALSVEVSVNPPRRITLTYPILNSAEAVYFLISGPDKGEVMRRLMDGANDFHDLPAAGIQPASGNLTWWLDDTVMHA
jgi:6-phosphogluconolactonase